MLTTSKIQDVLTDSWSQFQGALKQVENDLQRSYDRVRDLGESSVEDTHKLWGDWVDNAKTTKEHLNRQLDDGLQRTATLFSIASRDEFAALNERLDTIERKLSDLKDKHPSNSGQRAA
jgi:polyhydroxyalkanoate synthesis regulator phasin